MADLRAAKLCKHHVEQFIADLTADPINNGCGGFLELCNVVKRVDLAAGGGHFVKQLLPLSMTFTRDSSRACFAASMTKPCCSSVRLFHVLSDMLRVMGLQKCLVSDRYLQI